MVRPVSTSPALDPWEHVARTFEPARPSRWPTPGALARHLNPRTIQTPALDLIDQDLVEAATTPDARLIITMAPQEGKSVRAAGDFPLWMLTRNPDLRIIVASYGQGLANRNGRGIRNRITANPELGLRIAPDNGAVGEWTIDGHEGGVYSVGIGGGITGRACDCISGDMRMESEYGPITAREAFERGVTRILAYDHTTGTPVWRKVEASRRISGRRVITVITKSGRRLVCTPDHRIHTSRGYVPAGSLRPGETLVGLVALGGMPPSSLPDLSLGSPQVEDDTVSVVLDGSDTAVDVYDFQVEGTHNFFAEGILVHNCMIIDDPIKNRTEAESRVYRERVWHWWTDEASARLAPGAPAVLILTRWHHDDLAGRLLAEPESPWRLLNIPAQADHRPEKGEVDPLGRAPGEFMVSTRGRTREQWELRKRTAGTRTWASLYQGRPTPDTGNLFPSDGWARYDRPLWLVRDDGARIVPDAMRDPDVEIIQSWDLAFKDTESSDYVVGQVWMRRGTQAFLLDQIRRRMGFTESCQAMLDMTARWPQAIAKLVEDKANGPAVMNALRAKVGGLIPVEPEGSKYARAVAITPLVEAHDVVLPDPVAVEGTAWVTDLTEEARDFPGASHDDTVDGMSQAVHRLLLVPMLAGQTLYPEDVLGDGVELDWVADLDY